MRITAKQIIACGISRSEASHLAEKTNPIFSLSSPSERWKKICREILLPEHPFPLHQLLHKLAHHDWDENKGTAPVWLPDENTIKKSNLFKFQKKLGVKDYNDLYKWSVCNRQKFWEMTAKKLGIKFKKSYKRLVDFSSSEKNISPLESPSWFAGAEMNIADSCFRPEKNQVNKTAIVFQDENSEIKKMSYHELESLANRVAKGLMQLGLKKNDAVAVCMMMTAEAVAIYLGIVKAGCAVVSIADSLAADEVQKRLEISKAKLLFTQDYIIRAGKKIPFYEKMIRANPKRIICLSYSEENTKTLLLRKKDLWWEDFLNFSKVQNFGKVNTSVSCFPADTINILFSSGTTGEPKAIPWNHTTPIKCAADGFFHHNIQSDDVIAWPTNIGWMMGPWLIFASLINRATIALFYDAPTSRSFGEFVQNVGVTVLGLVPSIVKRWRETDCMKELDWSKLKIFSSTGEASNPQDYFWLMSRAKGYRPVIEYCGGTEIGGGYITGTVVHPAVPSAFTTPSLGLDFIILDENGQAADNGELFIVPPSVGLSTTLLNKDHHKIYFADSPLCPPDTKGATGVLLSEEVKEFYSSSPNERDRVRLRSHGDQMEKIQGGFFRALGRADDTMNLGGIKVSSAEIERVLNETDGVVETAAIAVNPPDGGPSLLVIYTVLTEKGKQQNSDIKTIFQQQIKQRLNPLFKIHDIIIVDSLPRTASNKVMRRVLRKRYEQ